jgi:prevent-host-death family protein
MKEISIQELKRRLSSIVSEVAEGAEYTVTRHKRPVAQIGPAARGHLHRGSRFGKGRLKPFLRAGTKGEYLRILSDDREEERGKR